MALEGTIKTPLGPVQKKTALILGGGLAVIVGIVYYRQKQAAAATPTGDGTDNPINPATGYPYGSPEDAAALAEQASYVSPPTASGGGSSSIPPTGTGYVSNGAWTQGVIEYMSSTGAVEDITALSSALGKYITGAYVAPGSAEDSLISQAIAAQGYPPVSGPSGMPPAINRNPPQGSTTPPTDADPTLPAPSGLKAVRVDQGGVSIDWNPLPGAIGYKTFINGKQFGPSVVYSAAYINLPKRKTRYTIGVQGINVKNRTGHTAAIGVTTK
jgi:hypothetical protein